ncbi:hypothetical protein D3C79_920410 [compost metagenome]
MSSLTKAALICGSGSMIILISILINLPFVVQIFLLLTGLAVSAYGVLLLVKMIVRPTDKSSETTVEETNLSTLKKKKKPTSTF